MRKLYRDAKNAELINEQGDSIAQTAVDSARFQKQLEQLYENPFDDKKFDDLPEDAFENEVNNLIEWCEDLDYDKYVENWFTLATSSQQEGHPDESQIKVINAGLGELTLGIDTESA